MSRGSGAVEFQRGGGSTSRQQRTWGAASFAIVCDWPVGDRPLPFTVAGIERLRDLLGDFWAAVAKGYEAGKLDYQMAADVTAALGPYAEHYPGLADKVRRDIQNVYLQVEEASFK